MLLKRTSFFIVFFCTCFFLVQPDAKSAVRTRKIVCKRGKIRVTVVNGVKKYSCVVKKTRKKVRKNSSGVVERIPLLNGPLRYQASWWGRLAARTNDTPLLASNKYRAYLEGEQDIRESSRLVFGGRVTHDLMSNIQGDEYRDDFSQNKKPELELWNFFGEYKQDGWRLRLGQQQVAWGETFGFFYADVVNPKDLRERLLGRLSELRLPVPMANVQWSSEGISLQFLYLPLFSPDRLPTPKSDYFPELTDTGLPPGFDIDTTSSYELDDPKGDVGGRVSGTIKGVDFSLLYFNYIDRQPYYQLVQSALMDQRFLLERHHTRIQSSGLTFSTELDGWIIRSENIYTPSRSITSLKSGEIVESKSIQRVHVVGIDAPKWEKVQLGIQFSNDLLTGGTTPLLRKRELSLTTLRVAVDMADESLFETLATHAFGGQGELIQAIYTRPINDSHELELFVDQFMGSKTSFFGQTEKASRFYIGMRGAFNG